MTLLEPVDEVVVRVPDDVRRRGDERPVRPPRPGARHRARRGRRAQPGPGRGAGHRAGPVRGGAARDDLRRGHVHPHVRPARADAGAPGRRGPQGARRHADDGRRRTPRLGRTSQASSVQALASSRGCRASSCGSTLVRPITGMKLASPPHRGTTCWCRWAAMPAPATAPWFMPMLKPCGLLALPDHPHRLAGEGGQLDRLRLVQLGVVGDVPVRADQQVPRVVRVEVQHRVHPLAAGHHQAVRLGRRGARQNGQPAGFS